MRVSPDRSRSIQALESLLSQFPTGRRAAQANYTSPAQAPPSRRVTTAADFRAKVAAPNGFARRPAPLAAPILSAGLPLATTANWKHLRRQSTGLVPPPQRSAKRWAAGCRPIDRV